MRLTPPTQSKSHPRRHAFKPILFVLLAVSAQAALGLTRELPSVAGNHTFFWGVVTASIVISLLHYVHTLKKVFLFCGAAVFWGACALAGNSLDLAERFPLFAHAWQEMQLLATPLALWFVICLAMDALEYPHVPLGAKRWLRKAGIANLFLAVLALWFSAVRSLLPMFSGAVFLMLFALGVYGAITTKLQKKRMMRLLVDFFLAGSVLTFFSGPNPSTWTPPMALFAALSVCTVFLLADQQRSKALSAYQEQLITTDSQVNALEQFKAAENALEAKFSQRTHELHLAVQRLETLSAQDGLTGVANRHRFDQVLKAEYGRAARSRQALSVALIDVDWFIPFNGRYGHERGDACLCQLARVLESGVMRSGDLIARYSGGSFVLLAPDTDSNGIMSIANYLCQEVYGLDLPHEDSPYGRVSISIGVATAYSHEGAGPEHLVQRAAEGLASAKLQGHHRVVAA